MAALRSLLLGFEQGELEQLHQRLNNPNINAEELSRLLPEAIILRSLQDKLLQLNAGEEILVIHPAPKAVLNFGFVCPNQK